MRFSIDWCETMCPQLLYFLYRSVSMLVWHDFSAPSHSLSGFRQRRRELLWESSSPPETCPHLVESLPCEDPACYQWQVQQEERCIPTQSPCGPGTAVQNVTCVSAEGNVLNLHQVGVTPVFFPQLLMPEEYFWHFDVHTLYAELI